MGLSPRTRIYLDAAYASGKESDAESLDLAAYLDISLRPIARKELWTEDWQRRRYLWARIGYDRIFKATDGTRADVAEDRGIVSFFAKAPLPAEVWLEAGVRADLRWIGGDYSTRYRFRVEATREFTCSITRSFPTSTSSGSTTRATTAGQELSTRWAPKSR